MGGGRLWTRAYDVELVFGLFFGLSALGTAIKVIQVKLYLLSSIARCGSCNDFSNFTDFLKFSGRLNLLLLLRAAATKLVLNL